MRLKLLCAKLEAWLGCKAESCRFRMQKGPRANDSKLEVGWFKPGLREPYPNPWADPKSKSSLGVHNLHHGSIRMVNWGVYFLDLPRGLGSMWVACG